MKITFWNGDPNNGGREIPGELTHMDDGTFTFRPYMMPNTVAEIYVTSEDGKTVSMLPLGQMVR